MSYVLLLDVRIFCFSIMLTLISIIQQFWFVRLFLTEGFGVIFDFFTIRKKKIKLNIQGYLFVSYGESTMNRTQVQWWRNRFKEGGHVNDDDARPGCPSTSATEEENDIVTFLPFKNVYIWVR